MGLTSVRMQVADFAAPDIAEELEFLVDSGAIYSVVLAACGGPHAPVASPSARRAARVTTTVTATVASRPRTTTA